LQRHAERLSHCHPAFGFVTPCSVTGSVVLLKIKILAPPQKVLSYIITVVNDSLSMEYGQGH
jgi:hypothetical protein